MNAAAEAALEMADGRMAALRRHRGPNGSPDEDDEDEQRKEAKDKARRLDKERKAQKGEKIKRKLLDEFKSPTLLSKCSRPCSSCGHKDFLGFRFNDLNLNLTNILLLRASSLRGVSAAEFRQAKEEVSYACGTWGWYQGEKRRRLSELRQPASGDKAFGGDDEEEGTQAT